MYNARKDSCIDFGIDLDYCINLDPRINIGNSPLNTLHMTREERLKYCTVCKLRSFDPKHGTICSLTREAASFEATCPEYIEDEKALATEVKMKNERESENRKIINYGRYNLLFLGAVFLIFGLVEIFSSDYSPFNTFIFLTLSVSNFTLAFWSHENPMKANAIGLILFIAVISVEMALNPSSVLDGFATGAYSAVICAFTAAIFVSMAQMKKNCN